MSEIKKVLLIYTDPYYLVEQIYPYGLDLLAARLRQEEIEVRVEYAFLPSADPAANLSKTAADFSPDLVGLGIRNIDTCMACEDYGDVSGEGYRSFFFPPLIRAAANAVREVLPDVPMICGGGGFTVAPRHLLDYLDVDFGVAGEGEDALIAFVQAWPDLDRLARIPGLLMRSEKQYTENPRGKFAFPGGQKQERDPGFRHAFESSGLPVRVKRGCNQNCSFCVEPLIEGRTFIHRDIQDLIGELRDAAEMDEVKKIFFVDTEFNLPNLDYATALVESILAEGLHSRYRFASQFLPRPFTDDFAKLLAKARFSVILTCTSFADEVLEATGVSYREADIENALNLCTEHGIDATVDLIFGLPGETWETVAHSIRRMNDLPATPLRHYEYTVGARIYPGTALAQLVGGDGGRNVYGNQTPELLEPCFYCVPASPLELKKHVDARVPVPMRYANVLSESSRARLAVGYLADHGRFEEACKAYLSLSLPDKSAAFDYFFRLMADTGAPGMARLVAEDLRQAIAESNNPAYQGQAGVIEYYLAILSPAGI
ncbi:MAG: radical SAM protein [Desulfobulbaceae bacterium]|nr:radical SAM protein [Desulfobulbaceae bacterium]